MGVTVKVDGDNIRRAYVASVDFGLSVVNLNMSTAPEAEGNSDTGFSGGHIAVSETLAVVTGKDSGHLWVLDINDPAFPSVVGELDTTYYTFNDVALHVKMSTTDKTMAVVAAAYDGILVVDLTYPQAPSVIGRYNTPGCAYAVALNTQGTLAYVADGSDGFKILSLDNPQSPTLVGQMPFATAIYKDIAVNRWACLPGKPSGR